MAATRSAATPRAPSLWRRPLLVGVCFGLGYGLTQRLLDLRLPAFVQWGQSFDVRQMPGEGLDKLRLSAGGETQELRGRLGLETLPQEAKPSADGAAADQTDPASQDSTAGAAAGAPGALPLPSPEPAQPVPAAPPAPSQP